MQTLLLYLALGGMAAGSPADGLPAVQAPQRQQRLVIVFEDLAADAPEGQRQQRLDRLLEGEGMPAGLGLRWLRPLAVGGEVVAVSGVQPEQLEALCRAIAAQPGVRRVEIDGRVQTGPGPRLPVIRPGL